MSLRETVCIAMHPSGGTVLYTQRDGSCKELNKNGFDKLSCLTTERFRAAAVVLRTRSNYFLRFSDGRQYWDESDAVEDFDQIIGAKAAKMVTFGQEIDSCSVLYAVGWYAMRNIPVKLSKCVTSECWAKIAIVGIGSGGRYFARFSDASQSIGKVYSEKALHDHQVGSLGNEREKNFGDLVVIIRYTLLSQFRRTFMVPVQCFTSRTLSQMWV